MLGFRYRDLDLEGAMRARTLAELLKLFNDLLLRTHGDAGEALKLMRLLQRRGHIPADVDLDEFLSQLRARGVVVSGEGGPLKLADRGVQLLRRHSLDRTFRDLKAGGAGGEHRTPQGGGAGSEELPELREYSFGDDFSDISFTDSLWNALRREGHGEAQLAEEDLVVRDREWHSACATVLLLDISHSMILYGEDRFTPAKQVAMALTELILTRYRRDTLDVVLFGDDAWPVSVRDLPYAGVGPYHTNTKAGLMQARRILERRGTANKQIFMVTDGKPTVIHEAGGSVYRNSMGMDPRIVNRTLDEAVVCRRRGIRITTFMIASDPDLEQFVLRLSELNGGKAYLSSPERLGGFVLMDFLRHRRSRA